MKVIRLDATEVETLTAIGTMRNSVTGRNAPERKQDANQDGVQISIMGTMAEYAVAKYLNVHFDIDCSYRKFGADLVGRTKKTIDVKSTRTPGGNLNAVGWSEDKQADIFVLAEVDVPVVKIIGWIERETLLTPDNLRHPEGRTPYYSVPQSMLKPL